jgi:hypothetical protein
VFEETFTNIFVFEDTFCSINEMTNESSNNSQHYQYILCMQCQSTVFIVTFSISAKLAVACQGIPAGCPTLLILTHTPLYELFTYRHKLPVYPLLPQFILCPQRAASLRKGMQDHAS